MKPRWFSLPPRAFLWGCGAVSAAAPLSVTQNPLRREALCWTSRTERGIWGGARATARSADRDLENTGAVEIEFVDLAVAEVVAPDRKLLLESLGPPTLYVRAGVGTDDMAHSH